MKKDTLGLFPLDFSNKEFLEKLSFRLEEIFPANVMLNKALPIPEKALYASGLNFVFGEADRVNWPSLSKKL